MDKGPYWVGGGTCQYEGLKEGQGGRSRKRSDLVDFKDLCLYPKQ